MPVDRYRDELKAAGWTWNECTRYAGNHRKERINGRAAKRGSKQRDRREIEIEVAHDSTPVKP